MRPTPGTLLGKKHKFQHREMRMEVGGVGQVDISAHVGWWRPQSNELTRGTTQLKFSTFADGGSLLRRESAACCFPHPHTCNERRDFHLISRPIPEAADMNGRIQMQGGKNWILPKWVNASRFFWDSHWLEIWSNYFGPSMGLNGGSVATDSVAIQQRRFIIGLPVSPWVTPRKSINDKGR